MGLACGHIIVAQNIEAGHIIVPPILLSSKIILWAPIIWAKPMLWARNIILLDTKMGVWDGRSPLTGSKRLGDL